MFTPEKFFKSNSYYFNNDESLYYKAASFKRYPNYGFRNPEFTKEKSESKKPFVVPADTQILNINVILTLPKAEAPRSIFISIYRRRNIYIPGLHQGINDRAR
jgi:hypothetical protein